MAYTVDPPGINELTGQPEGEAVVSRRDFNTRQLTVDEPVDRDELNDALDPYYAQKTVEANLPVFDPNASDQAIISFWNSKEPLTEAQVSALQSAYVATNNEQIAALVQYRLTGDPSILSEEQRDELGLNDTEPVSEVEQTDEGDGDYAEQVSDYIFDNADEPSDEVAQQILNVATDGSDASTVIQHFAYQYYSGALSLDDCFDKALETGIDPDALAKAFANFQQQLTK